MNRWLFAKAFVTGLLVLLFINKDTALAADKDKAPVVPPAKGKSETIKLFNGKDLSGWEGFEDHWSVKDGVIVAKNTKPIKFSTYLLTKENYTEFRIVFSA